MGESNAGVASCALNHGAAWFQQTLAFGVLDDEESGAVLDGASGILEFCFAEDIAAGFF